MFRKLHHTLGLAVITALAPVMLAATPSLVLAQTQTDVQSPKVAVAVAAPTYSFGTAAGPVAGMIQIDPKSSNWFKFKYDYDNRDADHDPTQAVVRLKMATPGCVSFDVWTPARLREPQHNGLDADARNDRVTPVGSGTPEFIRTDHHTGDLNRDVFNPLTLTWAGSARSSDTYYIVVKNKTDAACNYSLAINGPDVSF
jgi:hypothetical protein